MCFANEDCKARGVEWVDYERPAGLCQERDRGANENGAGSGPAPSEGRKVGQLFSLKVTTTEKMTARGRPLMTIGS